MGPNQLASAGHCRVRTRTAGTQAEQVSCALECRELLHHHSINTHLALRGPEPSTLLQQHLGRGEPCFPHGGCCVTTVEPAQASSIGKFDSGCGKGLSFEPRRLRLSQQPWGMSGGLFGAPIQTWSSMSCARMATAAPEAGACLRGAWPWGQRQLWCFPLQARGHSSCRNVSSWGGWCWGCPAGVKLRQSCSPCCQQSYHAAELATWVPRRHRGGEDPVKFAARTLGRHFVECQGQVTSGVGSLLTPGALAAVGLWDLAATVIQCNLMLARVSSAW